MTGGSEALTYLRDKTVYWINLDRSTDRRLAWECDVGPVFAEAVRVCAHDWQVVCDETATRFIVDWHAAWSVHSGSGVFMHPPQSLTGYRLQTAKANFAIRQSHLNALSHGIGAANDRFFVSEDDVTPRSALWHEHVPVPPDGADVAIWSGGLPMAAVRTDDKEYAAGDRLRWVRVLPAHAFNTLGAGLYEVTPRAAELIRKLVLEHRMGSYDHGWGFALRDLTVYRLRPNAFPQVGTSIRNGVDRRPITERTTEPTKVST